MDVVRHEHVGVYDAARLPLRDAKRPAVEGEVLIGEKGGAPIDAPLRDVKRDAGYDLARQTRHGRVGEFDLG